MCKPLAVFRGFHSSSEGEKGGGVFAQAACRRSFALPFLPEYQGLFCIIVRRNRAKVLLYPFIKVKAHGFCIGNPEPAHPVTLAGNPVLAGDSAKRVKQILVGNRNNTFLFASWLGELEALRLVALAGTDRKYSCFRIQQTQNKGGISAFFTGDAFLQRLRPERCPADTAGFPVCTALLRGDLSPGGEPPHSGGADTLGGDTVPATVRPTVFLYTCASSQPTGGDGAV